MRAAIYNPYLDTLGGGEKYTIAFAQALVKNGYSVDVQWKSKSIKTKLEDRFGINLERIKIVKDVARGDGYDLCFWVSDGSIPLLRSRRNFLHFQIPFKGEGGQSLVNRMKFFRIEKIICNSYFTKKFIDLAFNVASIVLYPPVEITQFKPRKKEKLIFSVGRFSQLTQAKKQDVLIRAFKKFYDSGNRDWKMVLAGGVEVGIDSYVKRLKKVSIGYPIQILESPEFKKIKELYGKGMIFWSASGFGIDELKEPARVEHFGITVVEAMAAGAVPLIFSAGGHKEIVSTGENGFLWKKVPELIIKTKKVVFDKKLLKKLSIRAREDSKIYEQERFNAEVGKLIA